MSKNITIQEGGVGKQLTVDKLKTDLEGGGTCLWVPEDEVQLTTKTITENGTYKASDDGYYGYEQVIVNAPGSGTATGTDGDGDEAVAYPDPGTGRLVTDKVPSSIRVTTPPTNPHGIYSDGQTITTDGMVVKAYLKSGNLYNRTGYPNGVVPNNEVTLNPTTASYDPSTDYESGEASYDGETIPFTYAVSAVETVETEIEERVIEYEFDPTGNAYVVTVQQGPNINLVAFSLDSSMMSRTIATIKITNKITGQESEQILVDPGENFESYYDVNGTRKTFYYGNCRYTAVINAGPRPVDLSVSQVAKILFEGEKTTPQSGSHQAINVSWPRPHDGKALETAFEILVAQPNGSEE